VANVQRIEAAVGQCDPAAGGAIAHRPALDLSSASDRICPMRRSPYDCSSPKSPTIAA
jgi:hypothetical protein